MRMTKTLAAPLLGLVVSLGITPLTVQATMVGPDDMSFYDPPQVTTGAPGDLTWYRQTTVDLGAGGVAQA